MDRVGQATKKTEATNLNFAQLHECWPGGPIVTDRKECIQYDRAQTTAPSLPNIAIDFGGSKSDRSFQVAGKSTKNGMSDNDWDKTKGREEEEA